MASYNKLMLRNCGSKTVQAVSQTLPLVSRLSIHRPLMRHNNYESNASISRSDDCLKSLASTTSTSISSYNSDLLQWKKGIILCTYAQFLIQLRLYAQVPLTARVGNTNSAMKCCLLRRLQSMEGDPDQAFHSFSSY